MAARRATRAARVSALPSSKYDVPLPIVRPQRVMGIDFANPLGLAAGFDRTGHLLASLAPLGFGHIELGTITPGTANVTLPAAAATHLRIGVNIGSSRRGLNDRVIDDYLAALSRVWAGADYIVANLSSPFLERDGNVPGVEMLIERLAHAWRDQRRETGRQVPILIKIAYPSTGAPVCAALAEARKQKLSGVVLVSSCPRQIASACEWLDGAAVISVGGVASAEDVRSRLAAGAALVQIHTALVRDGPGTPHRILSSLEAGGGLASSAS
jgi:dihydroorotate dehydrogenase